MHLKPSAVFEKKLKMKKNIDLETVKGFGDEWRRVDQAALSQKELQDLFNRFFCLFPFDSIAGQFNGFWVLRGCSSSCA